MGKCQTITVEEVAQADINVTAIDMPSSVAPDETFTVTATVENTGNASGSATVELTVEGNVWADQGVSLNAGESTNVSFSVSISTTGSYSICVNAW